MIKGGEFDQWSNLELARKRASNIKHKVLNNLDRYLTEFEKNYVRHQGRIIWATTVKEAQKEILQIIKKTKAQYVYRSSGGIGSELDLHELLAKKEPVNQDSQLTDVAIFNVNFLIADAGSAVVMFNEGHEYFLSSVCKTQILLSGIENLIPSADDLDLFLSLLNSHTQDHFHSQYVNYLSGPGKNGDHGPEDLYLILLDNKRTELLKQKEQRKALSCIQCNACIEVCPVDFGAISGISEPLFKGPIGAVIQPWYKGFRESHHVSYASTLCGRCSEVCPVGIPLHDLLIENRAEAVKRDVVPGRWKKVMRIWYFFMKRRWLIDRSGSRIKNRILKHYLGKSWGAQRTLPRISKKSFGTLYREAFPER